MSSLTSVFVLFSPGTSTLVTTHGLVGSVTINHYQTASISVNHSVNAHQSVSINKSIDQSTNRPIDQTPCSENIIFKSLRLINACQSVSITQSIYRSINQSANHPLPSEVHLLWSFFAVIIPRIAWIICCRSSHSTLLNFASDSGAGVRASTSVLSVCCYISLPLRHRVSCALSNIYRNMNTSIHYVYLYASGKCHIVDLWCVYRTACFLFGVYHVFVLQ